jgi:hypothetical protein
VAVVVVVAGAVLVLKGMDSFVIILNPGRIGSLPLMLRVLVLRVLLLLLLLLLILPLPLPLREAA